MLIETLVYKQNIWENPISIQSNGLDILLDNMTRLDYYVREGLISEEEEKRIFNMLTSTDDQNQVMGQMLIDQLLFKTTEKRILWEK